MNWEKPLRVPRRLSGPAASFSHSPLFSQTVSPESERWGLPRQARAQESSECLCSLPVSFPLRAEPGGSPEEPSSGPLTPPGPQGAGHGGEGQCAGPCVAQSPTASPLFRVAARCGEGTRARRSHSAGLAGSALPLPSLLWLWPASRTFSQSGVVTGLPAGLDVLPAFQRVYDRLQMCLQEHTVPRAEINAGLTAVQAHPRERRRKTKTV